MPILKISLFFLLTTSQFAFSETGKSMDETYEETYQQMSAGMNPEEQSKNKSDD
jgi:hypothetical protein